MKFFCVKCRTSVEVPDDQIKEYVPTDTTKADKMKKANRVGYTTTHKCGTNMFTFRTVKK